MLRFYRSLCLVLFLLPYLGQAQKITREIEPDNHAVWLVTDDVNLNFKVITANTLLVHFRTIGSSIFMYIVAQGQAVSAQDYAVFITDKDTVVIHSTAMQPNGWENNVPFHEYTMTKDDLVKLSQNPLKQVVISHISGWQTVNIPENGQGKLVTYCTALLKAMNE